MKAKLILFSALFIVNVVCAQDDSSLNGIYLGKEDFLANKVHHLGQIHEQSIVKIGRNQTIVLKRGSEHETFKFKDVYGYFSNGERYRKFGAIKLFQKYGYARVLADRSLILYSAHYAVYKVGRTHYFYSVSAESPLRYLSKKNLRKDFSDNKAFLHLIRGLTYKEMISHREREYLLIELYEKSIKESR